MLGMLGRPANRGIRHHVRRSNVKAEKEANVLWPCKNCGRENNEDSAACELCGALRFDEIGDSGDNQDSEDLFYDETMM